MPPPPMGGSGQGEGNMGPLWLAVGFVAIIIATWMLGHAYIVTGFFALKHFEIQLIQFFTSGLQTLDKSLYATDPAKVSFTGLMYVANQVGNYLRYPVLAILLFLGALLFFRSTASKFKRTYNMKLLLNFGIQNFPQISATAKADLVHQDLTKGPWAMAMAPMAFAKRYKLLKEKIPVVSEMSLMKDAKIKVTVVRSKASRVFVMQLGKLWKGVEALPPHTKALFAAFAARAARDADASRKLLDKLALSFHSGKLDFAGVDNLIKKYGNEKIVVEAISKHAYVLTAMAALLEKARMDGVLSTADFLWLKAVDRKLWFMLNCIGRQTAFTEISGPFAHWLAEREVGRSLKIPVIDKAIDALDEAIQNIIYNPKTND